MLEAGLYTLLSGESTLTALVGTRIHPVELPINAVMPALMYRVVGGNSQPTFETSGPQRVRMEFSSFGQTHVQAATLRETLRVFLNGYRGVLGDGTWLQNAELLQNMDFFEQDPRQFRCMSEFYLYFNFTS